MNANFYDFVIKPFNLFGLSDLRSHLLSHAKGKTLEIGIGTGLNLPYYPHEAEVIGIEPDLDMKIKADQRARDFHARVDAGDAQALPYSDNEFDTVVATLVFCTIPDPHQAIHEVYRVLKPGGTFLVLEHVRKNTKITGKLLDLMTPAWGHIAGGCHLNRDPENDIKAAGFKVQEFHSLWRGLGKMWVLTK